jgi:hypothetical protein
MEIKDSFSEFGKTERWAFVWFFSVIIGGAFFVSKLYAMDAWMYQNNADFMDWKQYKENRLSQTMISSERTDPSARGSYDAAAGTKQLVGSPLENAHSRDVSTKH